MRRQILTRNGTIHDSREFPCSAPGQSQRVAYGSFRVAVLITCFNRRAVTLRSLSSLAAQDSLDRINTTTFLVDDSSSDGTAEAVQLQFPEVRLLRGDGTLFWEGGMRMAFAAARREEFDAYLFVNDDTVLYPDAIQKVVSCAREQLSSGSPAIVVGSTRSPVTGEHTYGGFFRRIRGPRLTLEKVMPDVSAAVPCDTMNCNFTLIPKEIAEVLGDLEPRFRHQFGDVDYGLRAKKAGFQVVVVPGYIGECAENHAAHLWRDSKASFDMRWRHLLSPKGVPFREWLLFTRRHYGWRWLLYFCSPYAKTILSGLVRGRFSRAR